MDSREAKTLFSVGKKHFVGWFLLTCFCVFQFSLQGSVGILADGLKASLNLDAASLSILSSSFYYSYVFMQIPVGFIFDRFGVRIIASLALLMVAVGSGIFATATSLPVAIFARILLGLACSFGFLGLAVATGKWFPARYFAVMIAATECLGMLGVAGLNNIMSQIVTHWDWRVACWFSAVVAMVIAFSVFLFAPQDDMISAEVRKIHGHKPHVVLMKSLKTVAGYREVWLGGLFAFAAFAVVTVFAGLWGIPFLMSTAKLDLVQATSLVSTIYIGTALSSPLVGWLSGFIRAHVLMGSSMILAFILTLVLIFGPKTSLLGLYVLIFLLGFVSSVYQLPFSIVNKVVADHVKGVAMGVTNIICMVSGPILQPMIGYVLIYAGKRQGDLNFESYPPEAFQYALLSLAACLLGAVFVGFSLKDRKAS